jgi:hypothetical protein
VASNARLSRRIDPIAAGWGGIVASLGPIIATSTGWPARLVIVAASFAIGGLLAGLRSPGRRVLHAAAAALMGLLVHLGFAVLTRLANLAGAPDGASVAPGGGAGWLKLAVWCLAWAMAGGFLVASRLDRHRAGRR